MPLTEEKKPLARTALDVAATVFRAALKIDVDNFLLRRGLGGAEEAVRASPKRTPAESKVAGRPRTSQGIVCTDETTTGSEIDVALLTVTETSSVPAPASLLSFLV